jgi:hypothetical protein
MAKIIKEKDKEKIKEKIKLPDEERKFRLLSAQDFMALSSDEKEALKLVITEADEDYTEYENKMKRLFPATIEPKILTWRKR